MTIIFFDDEFEVENFQFCSSKELRFYNVLNPQSEYFRFGCLIYVNKKLIGAVKHKGEVNLLSFKTSNNQINLKELRIYYLPKKLSDFLNKIPSEKNKKWIYINFETLYLKDSGVDMETFEKVKDTYEMLKKDFKRSLINNINVEYKQWEFRKTFDISINKDFFE